MYRLGVEHTEPGHWVAYVFDLPGCFASGASAAEGTARIPEVIRAYFLWRKDHGNSAELADGVETEITEVLDANGRLRTTSLGVVHDVWAFFDDDRRPLAKTEAGRLAAPCVLGGGSVGLGPSCPDGGEQEDPPPRRLG